MKTREDIITSMCYTCRHDYGLLKFDGSMFSGGMTTPERENLWEQMAQIFDNDILPYIEFKK